MRKTVVVRVDTIKKHPKYQKYYRVSKRFKAHDESGEYHTGDEVILHEAKPISKEKRWKVTALIRRTKTEAKAGEVGDDVTGEAE